MHLFQEEVRQLPAEGINEPSYSPPSSGEGILLTVECDASEHSLGATLSQNGSPVAFLFRTFTATEKRYSVIEKEAAAIMDAVRKWTHFLFGHRFILVTDQRAVSFLLDPKKLGLIKNTKLQLWRA